MGRNEEDQPLDALRSIDDQTLGILVQNHRKFQKYLAQRVGSPSQAEDLLQSALRKALESPPDSSDEGVITAWFYRVLKNTLADHYRAQASEERKHEGLLQAMNAEGRTFERPVDDLEAVVCECLNALLPTLKDSYAALIRRIDLAGESIQQVAKDMGVTENNLSIRLHRARQALKISLERTCGTCTEHGCLDCTCGESG